MQYNQLWVASKNEYEDLEKFNLNIPYSHAPQWDLRLIWD